MPSRCPMTMKKGKVRSTSKQKTHTAPLTTGFVVTIRYLFILYIFICFVKCCLVYLEGLQINVHVLTTTCLRFGGEGLLEEWNYSPTLQALPTLVCPFVPNLGLGLLMGTPKCRVLSTYFREPTKKRR